MEQEFQGTAGRYLEDSIPWWPPVATAPEGAPNVLVVLLDDVGYAQFGCYGSDIRTATFDRLSAGGLRYSNYHTTALCSPTRACLLTGRNHHASGMGRIVEFASGFPGYDATMPMANGMLSEILVRRGYSTFCLGKWHLSPAHEMAPGGSKQRWPLGRGFERFYGFLPGETDQYHPDLTYDNHQVSPPKSPEDGYHLTEDLADKAVSFLADLRAVAPTKPFLMWFAPGACHSPHQAPRSFIDGYAGQFDLGWDAWREKLFAKQKASGLLPDGTRLSDRPQWVPAWDSLGPAEKRLYARMMEVYAGFLDHTDAQVGKVIAAIESYGELDNTIVIVMSDNGASAEGGPRGSFNEMFFFNNVPESLDENLKRIDLLGGPEAHGHYPWGWAWAGNTPLKRWKRETHEGGVCDPLIVHWPARIKPDAANATRHQYVHSIDITPTLLDLLGIEAPSEIAGVAQTPFDGTSFAATFAAPSAPSKHTTQYYEMFGCRALYHDGWKAVVFHPLITAAYDGSDPRRPFDSDQWELYHVAEDFSECHELSKQFPEKLAELIELWWSEAERNQVLPITNMPGKHNDSRHRRERYEFRPGIGALPETVAPNLRNRMWRITATVTPDINGLAEGVICAHGSASAGYSLYVAQGRLHYVNNTLGASVTTITSEAELPAHGPTTVRCEFTPTGRFQGEVALFLGDVAVGSASLPLTVPVTYGPPGFTVGHQRGSPITPAYHPPFAFTPGALSAVVVEAEGRAWRDPAAEERAAMAIQ